MISVATVVGWCIPSLGPFRRSSLVIAVVSATLEDALRCVEMIVHCFRTIYVYQLKLAVN